MRIQIVGGGRMGTALHAALGAAGADVLPLAGRGATGKTGDGAGAELVLLAVPDAAIPDAARHIVRGPIVGHLSGMTGLAALAPHPAFSLHPLLSVTGPDTQFADAHAAVAGNTERALAAAESLASLLGMQTFHVADADRAAYHAAASLAANALVTLEDAAERLAGTAGVPRAALVPLVRAALENWAAGGAAAALTGPIVRGDEATIQRQRAAVADRVPADLPLFDALTAATRALAARLRTPGTELPSPESPVPVSPVPELPAPELLAFELLSPELPAPDLPTTEDPQ